MKRGLVVDREAQMIGVYLFEQERIYRGIPRKKVIKKTKIYAGDYVLGNIVDPETFAIEQVEERKNFLVRPPVANVDKVLVVVTIKMPEFDSFLLDNLLVVYEHLQTDPVIIFNKIDLLEDKEIQKLKRWTDIYKNAGYDLLHVSAEKNIGVEKLKSYLEGSISVLAGPSGVGKSSILSKLIGVQLETRQVSEKTERGRHTTTGVRLFRFGKNSFIGDTPGFSSVDALYFVDKKDVRLYFREFLDYKCRFPNCTHTREPDCAVRQAVKNGKIACERYKNYLKIIQEDLSLLENLCQ
ncbi:ribosome small subunit-dependent GTPase A [Persephonella sp.]|uniref:ribosome small subunit-dependent GTPase A n=1 Tax=Persephonella sp. TaxID=2060922 RepID=UPI002612A9AA|nr:ribosome small subunit-dependent GTPase A [Persephonella sp.]